MPKRGVVGATFGVRATLLENGMQHLLVAVNQFAEASPRRLFLRNRIALEPVSASVLVEINARADGLIDPPRIETETGVRTGLGGCRRAE